MNRNRAAIPAAIMAASLFAASAHAAPPYHLPPEIEHILALPEDKIDMGMAALVFAHAIFPEHVNVFAGSREIDRLADGHLDLDQGGDLPTRHGQCSESFKTGGA